MPKSILLNLCFTIILMSCGSSTRKGQSNSKVDIEETGITSSNTLDQGLVTQLDSLEFQKPKSLMDLPKSQDGGFVLSQGFYEAEFKSYCLQPGTPSPSPRDAYLEGSVSGYRKEIIKSILRNSEDRPDLNQKNIQLLLWSTVSGSNFDKLPQAVKATAYRVLSSKQIFELKGGVVGLVKTISASLPSGNNDLNKLFEIGTSSYEAFERMAVLHETSKISRPEVKTNQWYQQKEGYYVRYFPKSYQNVRIQVYVPDMLMTDQGNYVVYDPVTRVAIPVNSNAQRLGIGGPVIEIVRAIITIPKGPGATKKLPPPENKNPKMRTK
ncbi:MAG: hypothetical protein ACKVOW_03595 [Chitinophagaceae bacterium]